MNTRLLFITLFAAVFLYEFAATGQEISEKKLVRIDIARGGLHCPILGPQLKEKLSRLDGAGDIIMNTNDSYITMKLPAASPVLKEDLVKMANGLGYPEKDISVSFSEMQNNPENIKR